MRLDEYLETVSAQIRCTKIRAELTDELKAHIFDQAESYEQCGAFPEEALERAIREMGDPVETGVALDRIHRPQMNRKLVLGIACISLFSILFFYLVNRQVLGGMTANPVSWQRQACFVLIGFVLMLIVYRIDYSILGNLGWKPAVFYAIFIFTGWLCFSRPIYGTRCWIILSGCYISVSEAMLLYVPLFAAALYSFRQDDYHVLFKVLPMILLPVGFLWQTPDLSTALILFFSLFGLFFFAVAKRWYRVNRAWLLGILGGILLLMPPALLAKLYFFGPSYQVERIRAFFGAAENGNYITGLARHIRESSALIGKSQASLELFANGPSKDFLTDYVLVSMCSVYGIFLTIAIIAALMLIIFKMFHISVKQKNQLGSIVGVGCGLVFFIKTLCSVLVNLQLIPYVSISMPFLSYGGSGTIVSYLLLGLVLSIYRYQNILPSKKTSQEALFPNL